MKMSLSTVLEKGTWIGLASSVIMLLVCIMLGALLIVKGVLPPSMQSVWVYASCALAAFTGSMVSRKGKGNGGSALATTLLLYGLLWIMALASSKPLTFGTHGLWITAAVLGGGLLAGIIRKGSSRKKRAKHMTKTVAKRRNRAVT